MLDLKAVLTIWKYAGIALIFTDYNHSLKIPYDEIIRNASEENVANVGKTR